MSPTDVLPTLNSVANFVTPSPLSKRFRTSSLSLREEEDEDFPESVRVCRGGNALSPVLNSPAICERKGRKKGVRERRVGRQKEGWSSIKRVVPGPTNGNPAEKPRDGPSCICIVCNDIPKRNWKGVSGKRGGIFKRRERFEERNKV
ncbi:hypothetical protein TNCV_3324761 [Trichonephila clavipes]|nr:hypothetical protein TNCV_3324761 [Trichonephila clavipes]